MTHHHTGSSDAETSTVRLIGIPTEREDPLKRRTDSLNSDRARWLRDALIQDNRDLLARAPDDTAGKLRKMASSPYTYFRGTAAIFWRDAVAPDRETPTSYGAPPDHLTLLIGDPHPENIGSFHGKDDRIHIEFNDFDASTYGPYHLDARRLALGFFMLAASSRDLRGDAARIAGAVARGYADEILAHVAGDAPTLFTFERGEGEAKAGAILGDLIRRAERDGDAREELTEYAPVDGDARAMFYGELAAPEVEGVVRDHVDPVTYAERDLIDAIMVTYEQSLVASNDVSSRALRVKGTSRRLGSGVSSYPVRRFYVLTEGLTDALDDDLLLELKEALDPPLLSLQPDPDHASNAERVVRHQRALQARPDQDPWLGYARVDDLSFKVRHRTKYQKGIDVSRIVQEVAEGDYALDAVLELATQSGHLLAASHVRAPTSRGEHALPMIAAAIGDDADGFVTETTSFATSYGAQTLNDYDILRDYISHHGDALGFLTSPPLEP